MDGSAGKTRLKDYLSFAGILACNVNPYLPSLSDIGCTWQDMTELMNEQGLFYSKAYRGRTTLFSTEVYFLIKACRREKPLSEVGARLLEIVYRLEPAESETFRNVSMLECAAFSKAMDTLLANMHVTALKTGRAINPNWSTFMYGTAKTWEKYVKKPAFSNEPANELKRILLRTMPQDEFMRFCRFTLST